MNFKVSFAKNGEKTLILNDFPLYSLYEPLKDSSRIIQKEYNPDAPGYLLFGLGLGYHLFHLYQLNPNKKIMVLLIDKNEKNFFQEHSPFQDLLEKDSIMIIHENNINIVRSDFQIIIPFSFMKAIGVRHHISPFLEDIKIRQMSHQTFGDKLKENFYKNILNNDETIKHIEPFKLNNLSACLVAGGPSLDETGYLLSTIKNKSFILSVGSSLKALLSIGICPDAVIITDAQENVVSQIEESGYKGLLFYMATANHQMTQFHEGKRIILFQEGYSLSEAEAENRSAMTLETGGSVATTGLSLLEYFGFSKVYLFGQDFGFQGNKTHSYLSTSALDLPKDLSFRKVPTNSGKLINTTFNLSTYHRWFERKAKKTKMSIKNTAFDGARINGIPYITDDQFIKDNESKIEIDFNKVINRFLKK